jgi:hypothetical protein
VRAQAALAVVTFAGNVLLLVLRGFTGRILDHIRKAAQ